MWWLLFSFLSMGEKEWKLAFSGKVGFLYPVSGYSTEEGLYGGGFGCGVLFLSEPFAVDANAYLFWGPEPDLNLDVDIFRAIKSGRFSHMFGGGLGFSGIGNGSVNFHLIYQLMLFRDLMINAIPEVRFNYILPREEGESARMGISILLGVALSI